MKKKKTAELESLLAIENSRVAHNKKLATTKLSKPLVKIVEVHSP